MKLLNAKAHGIVDYLVVVFLFASPTLLGLSNLIANLTYGLGTVHLLLTALTNFPLGIVGVIPIRIHGLIELLVSILLISTPFFLNDMEGFSPLDEYFFAGFGVAVLITWLISDYKLPVK